MPLLLLFAAILEGAWREEPSKEPGNFGDPFGLNMYTEDMRSKEINNGRMAMISMLGIFAAEVATGKDAIEQFGPSAVAGRASRRNSSSSFAGATAQGPRSVQSRVSGERCPAGAPVQPGGAGGCHGAFWLPRPRGLHQGGQ